jgi:hypothetical protein
MMIKTPSTLSTRPAGAFAAQSRVLKCSRRLTVLAALKQGDKAPEFELKNQVNATLDS